MSTQTTTLNNVDDHHCKYCRKTLPELSQFCGYCGAAVESLVSSFHDDETGFTEIDKTVMTHEGPLLKGKWLLKEIIGHGGMGVVYLAHDLQNKNPVAIKLLHAVSSDKEQKHKLNRFEREAQSLADCQHDNIVKFLLWDQDGGHHFMVMEYLQGEGLDALSKRNQQLPYPMIAHIFTQAFSGLEYIHKMGWIHRDLKPSNVMLTEKGQIKLLDMGLAKTLKQEVSHKLTATDIILGTQAYMAPEQWINAAQVDNRADLFSIGAILYELVTGKLPDYSPVSDTHNPLTPPSVLRPNLPDGLEELILGLLKFDPEARIQTAAQANTILNEICIKAQIKPDLKKSLIKTQMTQAIPGNDASSKTKMSQLQERYFNETHHTSADDGITFPSSASGISNDTARETDLTLGGKSSPIKLYGIIATIIIALALLIYGFVRNQTNESTQSTTTKVEDLLDSTQNASQMKLDPEQGIETKDLKDTPSLTPIPAKNLNTKISKTKRERQPIKKATETKKSSEEKSETGGNVFMDIDKPWQDSNPTAPSQADKAQQKN